MGDRRVAQPQSFYENMRIRKARETDKRRWDEYVCTHPAGTPYHLTAWTQAVTKAYGFDCCNFIAETEHEVCGVLPLVKMGIPLRKKRLIALPYGDVGSILANGIEAEEALMDAALVQAKSESVEMVELRGDLQRQTIDRPECNLTKHADKKVRMLLALPGSSGELWSGFKSKLRSQIKKAEKNGLTFEFANSRVGDFYMVISRNMRDLGSPVHSRKWYESIVELYGPNAKVALVSLGAKVVGAALILRAGSKVSIPWASTLRDFNHLNPNMLLYWGVLKYSSDAGCTVFDFGRSTLDGGTYKFKAQWGAEPKQLLWYQWHLKDVPAGGASDIGKVREVVEEIWKRLPLGASRIIGPWIRKYISL